MLVFEGFLNIDSLFNLVGNGKIFRGDTKEAEDGTKSVQLLWPSIGCRSRPGVGMAMGHYAGSGQQGNGVVL